MKTPLRGPAVLNRRVVAAVCLALLTVATSCRSVQALDISSFYSPRNDERPLRKSTRFIVLHTTEGAKEGSLKKVHQRGETHYFIDEKGHVYRIIHRDRVALHAGRSMWDGLTNLDEYSLGIEVVGYHNRPIKEAQYAALRELIAELQGIYGVPDDHVLCHSMVAYGAPNRWHSKSHRGRKRCGMLFAKKSVRRKLGLTDEPQFDPDVRAGRLVVGDPYLAEVLYGDVRRQEQAAARFAANDVNVIAAGRSAWDIARDLYDNHGTTYVFPDGKRLQGDEIRDWKRIPPGTRVVLDEGQRENSFEEASEVGHDGSARDIAGEEYNRRTTIYFFVDGRIRRGDELTPGELESVPDGTRVLVRYTAGGRITARRSAFDICGERWKFPSTLYRFPDGSIHAGDTIDENAIPKDSLVFYRN